MITTWIPNKPSFDQILAFLISFSCLNFPRQGTYVDVAQRQRQQPQNDAKLQHQRVGKKDRQTSFRFASPPSSKLFLKTSHSRRHSSSTLLCASNDFLYYDGNNVDKYQADKSLTNDVLRNVTPSATTPKKKRLSQIFGKLGFESVVDKTSPTDKSASPRHSWAVALFRGRRKEQKLSSPRTSFCKIEEESSSVNVATMTPEKSGNETTATATMSTSSSVASSNYRRRFKSKSERDLESVAKLSLNSGIRSIERGSQTESESESTSFGFANIWFRFKLDISSKISCIYF